MCVWVCVRNEDTEEKEVEEQEKKEEEEEELLNARQGVSFLCAAAGQGKNAGCNNKDKHV